MRIATIFLLAYMAFSQAPADRSTSQLAYVGTEVMADPAEGEALVTLTVDVGQASTSGRMIFYVDGANQGNFDNGITAFVSSDPCGTAIPTPFVDPVTMNEINFFDPMVDGVTRDMNGNFRYAVDFIDIPNFVVPDSPDVNTVVVLDSNGDSSFCVPLVNSFSTEQFILSESALNQIDIVGEQLALSDLASVYGAVYQSDEAFYSYIFSTIEVAEMELIGDFFTEDMLFISHVHNATCGLNTPSPPGGGPHWMFEVIDGPAIEANELWLRFDTSPAMNPDGILRAFVSTDVTVTPDDYENDQNPFLLSIVVHDTPTEGAPRILCADLTVVEPAQPTGTLAYAGLTATPAAVDGVDAQVLVTLAVDEASATTEGRMLFFSPEAMQFDMGGFSATVGDSPCAMNDGGDPFLLDPNMVDDMSAANTFTFYFNGAVDSDPVPVSITDGEKFAAADFRTNMNFAIPNRDDVQSVFVVNNAGDRVFCVDLTNFFDNEAVLLSETEEGDLEDQVNPDFAVQALSYASVYRSDSVFYSFLFSRIEDDENADGVPEVVFTEGLEYISHVHNESCALNTPSPPGGGPHWMFEVMDGPAIEANELWLRFNPTPELNPNGILEAFSAMDATDVPPGYDGNQDPFIFAVVVHDTPTPGAPRILCTEMTPVLPFPVVATGAPTAAPTSSAFSVFAGIATVFFAAVASFF